MISVVPLQLPSINLATFRPLIPDINQFDTLRLSAAQKFNSLCEEVISIECGFKHLYATIFIRIPSPLYPILMGLRYADGLKVTLDVDGMNCNGIYSGSLDTWINLVQQNTDDSFIRAVLISIRKILNDQALFHGSQPEDVSDRTHLRR